MNNNELFLTPSLDKDYVKPKPNLLFEQYYLVNVYVNGFKRVIYAHFSRLKIRTSSRSNFLI